MVLDVTRISVFGSLKTSYCLELIYLMFIGLDPDEFSASIMVRLSTLTHGQIISFFYFGGICGGGRFGLKIAANTLQAECIEIDFQRKDAIECIGLLDKDRKETVVLVVSALTQEGI